MHDCNDELAIKTRETIKQLPRDVRKRLGHFLKEGIAPAYGIVCMVEEGSGISIETAGQVRRALEKHIDKIRIFESDEN